MTLAGRTVLVTGADGFIGSHLAERLVGEGASVRAMCLYNSNGSRGWLDSSPKEIANEMEVIVGDVRDPGLAQRVTAGVEIVFHLAALIAIPYSYSAPASYIQTNVQGTLNMLEAARSAGVERFIQTSTSEVYGNAPVVPITEDSRLCAQSPYSASKIAADKLCEAYAFSFDLPVVILRPFNTYGPRQSRRAVIPTILSQLQAGCETVALGSLHPQRDYTYVSDTCEGFVRLAEAPLSTGEVIQLGWGRAISVADLFDLCCDVTGREAIVVVEGERVRPKHSEIDILLSDPRRAQALFGWDPVVKLRQGIELTAAWWTGRSGPASAAEYMR